MTSDSKKMAELMQNHLASSWCNHLFSGTRKTLESHETSENTSLNCRILPSSLSSVQFLLIYNTRWSCFFFLFIQENWLSSWLSSFPSHACYSLYFSPSTYEPALFFINFFLSLRIVRVGLKSAAVLSSLKKKKLNSNDSDSFFQIALLHYPLKILDRLVVSRLTF